MSVTKSVLYIGTLLIFLAVADGKVLVKRQTFAFVQPYYIFCLNAFVPGTVVGQLSTTSGSPVTWRINATNSNVAIDFNTGKLTLINYVQQGTSQIVQTNATNSAGQVISTNVLITSCSSASTSATTVTVSGIPKFAQSSYSLSTTGCTLGTLLGTIAATSATGLPTTYAVIGATSYYYIAPTTGQLYLTGNTPTTSTTITVQATNSAGTVTVPVIVTTGVCSTTTTTTTMTPVTYPLYGQTSYNFPLLTCTALAPINQVFASSPNPVVTYTTTSNQFTVGLANGLVSVGATTLTTGVYALTVLATDAALNTKTTVVIVNCA